MISYSGIIKSPVLFIELFFALLSKITWTLFVYFCFWMLCSVLLIFLSFYQDHLVFITVDL